MIKISSPGTPDNQPNDLTQQEMADLSAAKRNTVLYEKIIKDLKEDMGGLKSQNTLLLQKDSDHQRVCETHGMLRRSIIETHVSFALATVAMVVGGALISSYPIQHDDVPWQFAAGWCAIVLGVVFGVMSRVLVWMIGKLSSHET